MNDDHLTVKVRCSHGHEYDQTLRTEQIATGHGGFVSIAALFMNLIPCCGVCGERDGYTVELWARYFKPVKDLTYPPKP